MLVIKRFLEKLLVIGDDVTGECNLHIHQRCQITLNVTVILPKCYYLITAVSVWTLFSNVEVIQMLENWF